MTSLCWWAIRHIFASTALSINIIFVIGQRKTSRINTNVPFIVKVPSWCIVYQRGIINSHIFREDGINVIIRSALYASMIETIFIQVPRRKRINSQHMWFQQDGATANTANASVTVVRIEDCSRNGSFLDSVMVHDSPGFHTLPHVTSFRGQGGYVLWHWIFRYIKENTRRIKYGKLFTMIINFNKC